MGCFQCCFGKSKNVKRRRHGHKFLPREKRNKILETDSSSASLDEKMDDLDNVVSPVLELNVRHNPQEQSNLTGKKKVTFNSNVKMYGSRLPDVGVDFPLESCDIGGEKEELSAKSNQSCEDSNYTSRHQDCRDHGRRYEDINYEDSDLGEEFEDFFVDAEDGTMDESDDATVTCQGGQFVEIENAGNRSL